MKPTRNGESTFDIVFHSDINAIDSSQWIYQLGGLEGIVDDEECQLSNIKWHVIIEAI
jgi:lactam utilization protein B